MENNFKVCKVFTLKLQLLLKLVADLRYDKYFVFPSQPVNAIVAKPRRNYEFVQQLKKWLTQMQPSRRRPLCVSLPLCLSSAWLNLFLWNQLPSPEPCGMALGERALWIAAAAALWHSQLISQLQQLTLNRPRFECDRIQITQSLGLGSLVSVSGKFFVIFGKKIAQFGLFFFKTIYSIRVTQKFWISSRTRIQVW